MTRKRGNGEGSIYKRKDGRWAAKYTSSNGKRKEVYGKTRKEVAKKVVEAISRREEGLSSEDIPKLVEYLNTWLNGSVKGSVRERTFERYEEISRKHLTPELGSTKLNNLTPAQVQGLYRRKLDSGASPRTVQYIHATLHKALKQAVKWGLIPTNVTEAVTPPRLLKKEIKPLSPEQVQIFLKSIEGDRLEAIYVLAITTGLRQGELLGLKWEDIDLDAGMIRVRRTLSKSNKSLVFNPPKSAKGNRNVGLTDLGIRILKKHQTLQNEDKVSWTEDHGLIFPNTDGRPRSSRGYLTEALKKVIKKASLPEIRFHDLRHTCATLLLTRGIHPKIVQEMLGHSTISITLDTYSHVLPNMQKEAVKAMKDLVE